MKDLPNFIAERRKRAEIVLNELNTPSVFGSGKPISIPGGFDQTYPFISHPAYYWLTGDSRPGSFLCYDGVWRHFQEPISDAERIWEGVTEEISGEPIDAMQPWLVKNKSFAILGDCIQGGFSDEKRNQELDLHICHARRSKDEYEIELVKKAVVATHAGHQAAADFIQEGVTEREIQTKLENGFFENGADSVGYGTIVGVDTNAAVLHFTPTSKKVKKNGIVLIDAGAGVKRYVADVTRTYKVGNLSSQQNELYQIVLNALNASIAICQVGVEWHDVHRASVIEICKGLLSLGLIKGDCEDLTESGLIALFFPHGVGHAVGLGVRDAGGRLPGRNRESKCCGMTVRVDLPLETGYLMTVEPGVYFMPAILNNSDNRTKFSEQVNWSEVDKWMDFGGVRIEDNILISDAGPVNLTEAIQK